ncbi:MAG: hypothetical protein VW378_05280 [bacterium]
MNKDYKRLLELIPSVDDYNWALHTGEWRPHVSFFASTHYNKKHVSTDSKGFRQTYIKDSLIKLDNMATQPINIMLGGSVTFGAGASSDKKTIPSYLNNIDLDDQSKWVNFGANGFTGGQELILFMMYRHLFQNIKRVILFSGYNDIRIFFMSDKYNNDFGTVHHASLFRKTFVPNIEHSFISRVIRKLIDSFYSKEIKKYGIDMNTIKLKPLINFLRKKITYKQLQQTTHQSAFYKIQDHKKEVKNIIQPIKNNFSNWEILSKQLGFEIIYIMQPYYKWCNKKLTKEEQELIDLYHIRRKRDGVVKDDMDENLYKWYQAEMTKICQTHNIMFFDMNQELKKYDIKNEWIFWDTQHMTDRGNEICARVIQDII